MSTSKYGRAGRDLPAAIAVGIGLISLVTAALFYDSILFAFVAAFVVVLAVREMNLAFVVGLSSRMALLLQLCAPLIVLVTALSDEKGLLLAYVSSVIAVLIIRLIDGQEAYVHHVTRSIFILTYAPLLTSFAILISIQENGAWKVMALILLTTATDLGAYITGVLFGNHKIAPKISPNKSWEGTAGAFLLSAITGSLLWTKVFEQPWYEGVFVALILLIFATFGDLIESIIKRDIGIKDMSALLPGHGGIMDRIDSLVVNAFVAWALFSIFL